MTRLVTRVLVGTTGCLVLLLLVEWLPAAPPTVPHIQAPRAIVGQPGTRLAVRETDEWVNAILARPLFSISRRPPKVAAARNAGAISGIPRLSGIMIAAGLKRAIFAPEGGAKPLVLGEGQSLADTSIRTILPGQVILASGEVLHPTFDSNRVATTGPIYPPGLPNPGFQPPGFQPPGFQPPPFQPPAFQPPAFQAPGAEGNEPQQPSGPPFRGMMMPQRRE